MNEQNTNQQPNRIPDFSSIEEEAAFWDTHDTTDFEEEFHPVTIHFDKDLSEYHLSKKLEVMNPRINSGGLQHSDEGSASPEHDQSQS